MVGRGGREGWLWQWSGDGDGGGDVGNHVWIAISFRVERKKWTHTVEGGRKSEEEGRERE